MSPAKQNNTVTGSCLNEKLSMWEGEEDACCLMHHPHEPAIRTSTHWPSSQKSNLGRPPQGRGLCQASLKDITTNHTDTSEPTNAAALDLIFLSKHFTCKSPLPSSLAEPRSTGGSNTQTQFALCVLWMQWLRGSRSFSENFGLKSWGRQTEQSFSSDYSILNTLSACAHSVLLVTSSTFLIAVTAYSFANSIASSSVLPAFKNSNTRIILGQQEKDYFWAPLDSLTAEAFYHAWKA